MITSIANSKIKNLIKIKQKSKVRKEQGVFIAEGFKMYQETPVNDIEKVYISKTYYNKKKSDFSDPKIPVEIVEDAVFKAVSDTVTPQGILTVIRQKQYSLDQMLKDESPCLLLLDSLQDPGNLGTIIRTAEAAGVTGIIMNKTTVDIYNPKTIRSTMGSIYRVPFIYVDNLVDSVERMQKRGVFVYAAHLKGSVDYDKISYKKGTAFLIGNEGNGISEELSEKADQYIKIPMLGQIESLNAAVAASLLVYEAYRQRR